MVAPGFKNNPATTTSETRPFTSQSDSEEEEEGNVNGSEKRKRRKQRRVENKAAGIWDVAKEQILRPGVAGGLIGLGTPHEFVISYAYIHQLTVNVGLLGYASYALYSNPSLRRDARALSVGGVSLLALFGAEGFAAERYAQTPSGRAERKRAQDEGAALYRHSREIVLRPGVLGGLVGLVNVGILGGVGYAAYSTWDSPRWDRRVVSSVTAGLLGLWSAEGALAEKYRESRK